MNPTVAESLSENLLTMRNRSVARGVATTHPIFVSRGKGARLWDVNGKEYIDFTGGIGVLNVGHTHPKVTAAVKAQLESLTHSCFQVAMYEPYIRLAERLNALASLGHPTKTAFFTTGAEAVENAIKIARAYTSRAAVVAFTGGFHGRTLLGMTLTATSQTYRQNFGPFAPEVYHVPFPYEYRGWTSEKSLDALSELFETRIGPERVAAVIIEPQLGEGGFVPVPPQFMKALRLLTEKHGMVLITDEIQSGFGRTGKMFGFQHYGIKPDLITMAKSLAAGLPLAAVVGKEEIMDAPQPGGLGGTYGGNPLACAAALAVLEIFEEENLLGYAEQQGHLLRSSFLKLQQRFPQIGDVRGLGAMIAMELVKDQETKQPHPELTQRVLDAARERGLLLIKCGIFKNVIRMLAPLVATSQDMEEGLKILELALADVNL